MLDGAVVPRRERWMPKIVPQMQEEVFAGVLESRATPGCKPSHRLGWTAHSYLWLCHDVA